MQAYIIMEGGGVKGCALAGALAAAENARIEPIGFGGSSAGAIVATLASAGYKAKEIGEILVDLDLVDLLDGKGEELKKLIATLRSASESTLPSTLKMVFSAPIAAYKFRRYLKKYWTTFGLYDGDALVTVIEELIKTKLPDFTRKTTFQEFADMGALPLRVVASNITQRKPIVFSASETSDSAVLDAVRSSASYPFLYSPTLSDNEHLLDGGLSSNLPCFLYTDEFNDYGHFTLLLDLYQPGFKSRMAANILQFVSHLFSTALESSDHILRRIGRGTYAVQVEVPESVSTLDFFIDRDTRQNLYDSGFRSAALEIGDLEPVKRMNVAGGEQVRRLQALYGEPDLYSLVLRAILNYVVTTSRAENLRACIFLPTERNTLINTYNVGFEESPDVALELEQDEGAAWNIWNEPNLILPLDLESIEDEEYSYPLSETNKNLVEKSRKSLLCLPIFPDNQKVGEKRPIGVLSIDSATPLQETRWLDATITKGICDNILQWNGVIQRLIKASRL